MCLAFFPLCYTVLAMSRLPLVLLLGLTLGFAACGDGDGQDKAAPTVAAVPSPTAGPTPPAELLGPPFEGELLGIFIAPRRDPDPVPDTFVKPRDVCPPGTPSVNVPWEQAGEMALDVSLPPEYELQPYSANTGVIACGDTTTTARRNYTLGFADGVVADIVIGRSIFRFERYHVTANRVRTAAFAGREAVVIEPASPDGQHVSGVFASTRSGVFFPESFGKTFISASGLPTEKLLELAQLVAETTSRRTDIPEVDAVLDAVESGDADRVSALLRFTSTPCVPSTSARFGPVCGPDQEGGALVDVVPISDCKEGFSGRDGLDAALRFALVDPALSGVYRTPPGWEQRPYGVYPPAEYIAVFSRQVVRRDGRVTDRRQVFAVAIDQGEIVKVFFATPFPPSTCASTPAEIVAALGLEDAILPPA